MFDRSLNATFCPAVVPRDSTLALWATPAELTDLVPPTPAPTVPTPDVLVLRGPGNRKRIEIPCRHVPMVDLLPDADTDGRESRSVAALTRVLVHALELVTRGTSYPDATDDGVDVWRIGHLDGPTTDGLERLGGLLPPESFAVGGVGGTGTDPIDAVRGVIAHLTDLLPRTMTTRSTPNAGPWVAMAHSDVSRHRHTLRVGATGRRTVLQLRLTLPDHTGAPRRSGNTPDDPLDEVQDMAVWAFVRNPLEEREPIAASDLWSGVVTADPHVEHDLLFLLGRAATEWPPLARMLEDPSPSRLLLSPDEAAEFLATGARALTSTGVEVVAPTDMVRRLTTAPRLRVTGTAPGTPPAATTSSGLFTVDSLCEISWTALAGERELSRDEIDRILAEGSRLVRLADGWILLDDLTLERLRNRFATGAMGAVAAALDGYDGPSLVPPIEPSQRPRAVSRPPAPRIDQHISAFITSVLGAMTDHTFPTPAGLTAELRPYQRAGLSWSTKLFGAGFGGILADDMGLGKTIQMIALHVWSTTHPTRVLLSRRPTLVICPTGLLDNWEKEFSRWAPGVRVHRLHGPDRSVSGIAGGDVVVTTYGVVRRDIDLIDGIEWGLVIADEAQAFKNHESATASALATLSSGVRFALTGTPVENHLGELWSLFDWTSPGLLGHLTDFTESIAAPIERHGDEDAHRRLTTLTSPFMLRRSKMDTSIAPDLPPRTITDHRVDATPEQISLYVAATDELLAEINGSTGMARRGSILKLLTDLKMVTNHPAHRLGQTAPLSGRSGKFDMVSDLVTEIVGSGQSVVVFTQYVRMGELLVSGLGAGSDRARMLHGGLATTERSALVEGFQQREFPVLVVSLRAGGTGLNLTAATHVIHYDRWWNPAVENQASDRVWRIGQRFPVQVHRIVTNGTIEERIAELIDTKQDLARSVMGSSAWFTELDDEHLVELVLLRPTDDEPRGPRR